MPLIKKESITIRVPSKFKQKLEKIATYNRRTLSDFIRIELENIVIKEETDGILSKSKNTDE